ncbi:endonuclease V [Shimia sediminis]|uniref:endonuclease V n=1 Tax=Shimia sediminis TaxID=2497945 RepID=UPI00197F5104|nr:endonuclease V [Shimia sediminis]
MTPFRRLVIWLLAPLPRVPGAPLRFRKKLNAFHQTTDHYAGSLTTADAIFSGPRKELPGLLYHDFRFTWKDQTYRLYWHDKHHIHEPRHLKHPYPVWIDPWDLTSAWFLSKECKITPVLPEDEEEEDDGEEGPLMVVDVHYAGDTATAAAILFADWHREDPSETLTTTISPVAAYEPGAFYKRELPCIFALLDKMQTPPTLIIIDGYVTLGAEERDGLGMHLFRALNEKIPVIGVAKTQFQGTPDTAELLRGTSQQPLYVTAAGMSVEDAKSCIRAMHGPHRLPTLLTAADRLARDAAN